MSSREESLKRKARHYEDDIFGSDVQFYVVDGKLPVKKLIEYIREGHITNNVNNRGQPYDQGVSTSSVVWPSRRKNQSEVLEAHVRVYNPLNICVRSTKRNSSESASFNMRHVEERRFYANDQWLVFDGWNRCQTLMDFVDGRCYLYKIMDGDHGHNRLYFSEASKTFAMTHDPKARNGLILDETHQKSFLDSKVEIKFWQGSEPECEHQAYLLNTKQTDMSKFQEIKILLAKDPLTVRKQYVRAILEDEGNEFLQETGMSGEGQKLVASLVMKFDKPKLHIFSNTHTSSIQDFFECDDKLTADNKAAVETVLRVLATDLAPRIECIGPKRTKEILFVMTDMLMDKYLELSADPAHDSTNIENTLQTDTFPSRSKLQNICSNKTFCSDHKNKFLVNYLLGHL